MRTASSIIWKLNNCSPRIAAWRMHVRNRLVILAANWRLDRVDRLLDAGQGREARRVMAAVKRDVQREFVLLN